MVIFYDYGSSVDFCFQDVPCLFQYYKQPRILLVKIYDYTQPSQSMKYGELLNTYDDLKEFSEHIVGLRNIYKGTTRSQTKEDKWGNVWITKINNGFGFVVDEKFETTLANSKESRIKIYYYDETNFGTSHTLALHDKLFFKFPNEYCVASFFDVDAKDLPDINSIIQPNKENPVKINKLPEVEWNPELNKFVEAVGKGKPKRSPKIHTGPRGGKYIIKQGKKVYIK